MSSCYSSTRSSIAAALGLSATMVKTLAALNGQPRSWFEMSSHASRDEKHESGTDPFDIDILIYKLQMHQLAVEEGELRTTLENQVAKDDSDHSTDISILESLSPVNLDREHENSPAVAVADFRFSFTESATKDEDSTSTRASFKALPEVQDLSEAIFDIDNSKPLPSPGELPPEKELPELPAKVMTKEIQNRSNPGNMYRTKKPSPLNLVDAVVTPQEVQSASLPPRSTSRAAMHDYASQQASVKKHHRRMTISGARNPWSNPLLTESVGHFAEFDLPPVPDLMLALSTTTSPPSRSPATPTEDQIRRELEAHVIEEGVYGLAHKRTSAEPSKRRGVFIPGPEDVELEKPSKGKYVLHNTTKHEGASGDAGKDSSPKSNLSRKKSIFGRFERKNEVDQLLDLYLNDQQGQAEPEVKPKRARSRKHSFFRQRRPADLISPPIPTLG